jgi:hypothetical protein
MKFRFEEQITVDWEMGQHSAVIYTSQDGDEYIDNPDVLERLSIFLKELATAMRADKAGKPATNYRWKD